jgi:hypothetical protein
MLTDNEIRNIEYVANRSSDDTPWSNAGLIKNSIPLLIADLRETRGLPPP